MIFNLTAAKCTPQFWLEMKERNRKCTAATMVVHIASEISWRLYPCSLTMSAVPNTTPWLIPGSCLTPNCTFGGPASYGCSTADESLSKCSAFWFVPKVTVWHWCLFFGKQGQPKCLGNCLFSYLLVHWMEGTALLDSVPAPDRTVVAHAYEDAAISSHVRLTDGGQTLSVSQNCHPAARKQAHQKGVWEAEWPFFLDLFKNNFSEKAPQWSPFHVPGLCRIVHFQVPDIRFAVLGSQRQNLKIRNGKFTQWIACGNDRAKPRRPSTKQPPRVPTFCQ